MDTNRILEIIKNHTGKAALISALEEIQAKYTYLPEEALRLVSKETGLSLTDIYGVATFYKAFSLKPRGKHCVSACSGTACHVRGAERVVEEFKKQLALQPGDTTPDNEITFETVNCLGACALGPIVVSDGHYFANVSTQEVTGIIEGTKAGTYGSNNGLEGHDFSFTASCPHCGHSLMDAENQYDGHPSINVNAMLSDGTTWMKLSSVYGNFVKYFRQDVPEGILITVLCPHCGSSLESSNTCMECNAPMTMFQINGNGSMVEICTRAGCNGHLLTLNGAISR